MNLTSQHLESVRHGEPLRFIDRELSEEFVIVRADIFDRVRTLIDDFDLTPRETFSRMCHSADTDRDSVPQDVFDDLLKDS